MTARRYLDFMKELIAVRSILCPVDFSEESRQALRWAAALARRTTARLTVLSAVDPLLAQAAKVRLGVDLALPKPNPRFASSSRVHGPTTHQSLSMLTSTYV